MKRGIYDSVLMRTSPMALRNMWKKELLMHHWSARSDQLPAGIADGVAPEIYDAYRLGRDSACGDMVVATQKPDGAYAVLLSKRKDNVCFGGKWWIHGGALLSYSSITDFVASRTERECGVAVQPEVLLGVCRTCAPDYIGSTLQSCYAGRVPYAAIEKKLVDSGHTDVRLFTLDELDGIPPAERHWYPKWAAELTLQSLASL
jgi:ADP-ribose pyrophosphatase YjhB (NUDIX family)